MYSTPPARWAHLHPTPPAPTLARTPHLTPRLHPHRPRRPHLYQYNAGTDDKPRNAFVADSLNWVAGAPPPAAAAGGTLSVQVKTRHGENSHSAEVTLDAEGRAHVQLHGRDKGLAPGQFAAWYEGEVCLGSGVISEEGL